jgi:dUTPase
MTVEIALGRLGRPQLGLPAYETPGSAGADIRANLLPEDQRQGFTLDPMHRAMVPTGLRVEIPPLGSRCRSGPGRALR